MKRTKAERLRDLAEEVEKEYSQPIYSKEEKTKMASLSVKLLSIADSTEEQSL